jgi:hypothetical protein
MEWVRGTSVLITRPTLSFKIGESIQIFSIKFRTSLGGYPQVRILLSRLLGIKLMAYQFDALFQSKLC